MSLNIELLRDAVAWAEREAEKESGNWDQGTWASGVVGGRVLRDEDGELRQVLNISCGTSFCVAGNICASVGDRFVVETWEATPGETTDVEDVMPKGSKEVYDIENRAVDLLGVSVILEDGRDLFDGCNTIEEVREIAEAIAAEHGYVL